MKRGWTKQEKTELIKEVKNAIKFNTPIKYAFSSFAEKRGRQPNSVRNFYYSYLATAELLPEGITKSDIEVFSRKEAVELVSKILRLCAKGLSVRGAISLITGDKKKRLRYQNKYRNLVRQKSKIIFDAMEREKKALRYYDPFLKRIIEIEKTPVKTLVRDKKIPLYKETVVNYFDKLNEEADISEFKIKSK